MGHEPKWNLVTSRKYSFEGEFYPLELYEHVKAYLEKKQYHLSENEVEMTTMDGKIRIFTHLQAALEYNLRFHILVAFSINMGGNIVDSQTNKVKGTLELHANTFFKKFSLLHEKKETPLTIFLTKIYDTYIKPQAAEDAIIHGVIEMAKLVGEVREHATNFKK
ncbi:MAG: hypothetical protein ACMXYB_03185 [Candidatus Woesearchaeota archaeon]